MGNRPWSSRHPLAKIHQDERRWLRRELVAEGLPEDEIQERIAELREHQLQIRHGQPEATNDYLERLQEETYARFALPDRGYRQRTDDSLLTGAARATGQAARVARAKHTITRWQHDEREAR